MRSSSGQKMRNLRCISQLQARKHAGARRSREADQIIRSAERRSSFVTPLMRRRSDDADGNRSICRRPRFITPRISLITGVSFGACGAFHDTFLLRALEGERAIDAALFPRVLFARAAIVPVVSPAGDVRSVRTRRSAANSWSVVTFSCCSIDCAALKARQCSSGESLQRRAARCPDTRI